MRTRLVMAALALVTTSIPIAAHHSFAAFDQSKQMTLEGSVREFQWTNPHSWLQVTVQGPNGETQDWAVEMLSPNVLRRMGWKKDTLKFGDKVTVVINPARDGSHGGLMISVAGADGRKIGGPPQ